MARSDELRPRAPKRPRQCAEQKLDAWIAGPILPLKLNQMRLSREYASRTSGPKISVIMPAWNRAGVIRRAIDSVLMQSYRSFELIVVDDGSEDGTAEMIRDAYAGQKRLRLVRIDHGGVSRARNAGLESATGELVAYLDTDNAWSRDYLLLMANSLVDSPSCHTAYCGLHVRDRVHDIEYVLLRDHDRADLLRRNYIDLNVFIHRKSLFDRLGGFHPRLSGLEDWELILRYTRQHAPLVVNCVLAEYHFQRDLNHVSLDADFEAQYLEVRRIHRD